MPKTPPETPNPTGESSQGAAGISPLGSAAGPGTKFSTTGETDFWEIVGFGSERGIGVVPYLALI
jgi:hypothetical protein